MGASSELDRLLRQAGVIPYRRVGKVRVAHDPRTPAPTLGAALEAVRRFAATKDGYPEPAHETMVGWLNQGLKSAEACDDPIPAGVSPPAAPTDWLLGRCERYHFRLDAAAAGGLAFVASDGWNMQTISPLLPGWFVAACKMRRADLEAAVRARSDARRHDVHHPPPPDEHPATCPACQSPVWDREETGDLCPLAGCPYRGVADA